VPLLAAGLLVAPVIPKETQSQRSSQTLTFLPLPACRLPGKGKQSISHPLRWLASFFQISQIDFTEFPITNFLSGTLNSFARNLNLHSPSESSKHFNFLFSLLGTQLILSSILLRLFNGTSFFSLHTTFPPIGYPTLADISFPTSQARLERPKHASIEHRSTTYRQQWYLSPEADARTNLSPVQSWT